MPFSSDNGYTPSTIEDLMLVVMNGVNTQFGTLYDPTSFLGTNFYKFYYGLIQRLQENEVKTSEIFLKLQQYFKITNELISRPVVTSPGLVDALGAAGFVASVKPLVDADAGKVSVCVDTDSGAGDYAAKKLAINTLIMQYTVAGVVSQGTETSTITLSNGQAFDFKFALPEQITLYLRLTLTTSVNNQNVIDDIDVIKSRLLANIAARYRLGRDFEPRKYWNIHEDSPWCGDALLEWSDDSGANYHDTIITAEFDDLFLCPLAHVTVVEV
jgi:hypothetical protein